MRHRILQLVGVIAVAAGILVFGAGRAAPVAAQQGTENVELFRACNNVAVTWPSGTQTSVVAAAVSPASALVSIWRFNNSSQTFQGYSAQFPSASDLTTVNRFDPVFICMNAAGTLMRPQA